MAAIHAANAGIPEVTGLTKRYAATERLEYQIIEQMLQTLEINCTSPLFAKEPKTSESMEMETKEFASKDVVVLPPGVLSCSNNPGPTPQAASPVDPLILVTGDTLNEAARVMPSELSAQPSRPPPAHSSRDDPIASGTSAVAMEPMVADDVFSKTSVVIRTAPNVMHSIVQEHNDVNRKELLQSSKLELLRNTLVVLTCIVYTMALALVFLCERVHLELIPTAILGLIAGCSFPPDLFMYRKFFDKHKMT